MSNWGARGAPDPQKQVNCRTFAENCGRNGAENSKPGGGQPQLADRQGDAKANGTHRQSRVYRAAGQTIGTMSERPSCDFSTTSGDCILKHARCPPVLLLSPSALHCHRMATVCPPANHAQTLPLTMLCSRTSGKLFPSRTPVASEDRRRQRTPLPIWAFVYGRGRRAKRGHAR